MELIHGWSLDSNAREAKERLDQKLRSQRESVIKRHHSTGSIKLNRGATGGGGGGGRSTATAAMGVQREVYSRKGVMRRLMRWSRLRWDAAEQAECAVCLDEFAAGDVLAHLPCGHRFHWACALPWLEAGAAPRSCPFCRAAAGVLVLAMPLPCSVQWKLGMKKMCSKGALFYFILFTFFFVHVMFYYHFSLVFLRANQSVSLVNNFGGDLCVSHMII